MIVKEKIQTNKKAFVKDLFARTRDLQYAYLKFFFDDLSSLGTHTDIDLVVRKSELETWKDRCLKDERVRSFSWEKTSFAGYLALFFKDGSYLEIDLIHTIKRRDLVFLEPRAIIETAQVNHEGVKCANHYHSLVYTFLFYVLNGGPIPKKYQVFYQSLPLSEKQDFIRNFSNSYQIDLPLESPWENLEKQVDRIIDTLKSWPKNLGINILRGRWTYLQDNLKRPRIRISFSGVDGAGKSTILAKTKALLEEKYRQHVVVLRQRPSILPILSSLKYGKKGAEAHATKSLPRQGNNQSVLSSIIRFAYYYFDYVLGQHWINWRYSRRGVIILYDRYYYDHIADPRRANLAFNNTKWILKLFRFVHRPKLNFLLYADADEILKRKQELPREVINELTDSYLDTFSQLGKSYPKAQYISINNLDLQETLDKIEAHYVHCVSKTR